MEFPKDLAIHRSCLKDYINVSQIRETFVQPKHHPKLREKNHI
jgi:hypothetical protein